MIANCIYYAFSKVLFSIVFLLMLHFFSVTSCFFHVSRVTPTDHPFTSQNVFPYLYTTLVPLLFRAIIFLLFTCVLAQVLFFSTNSMIYAFLFRTVATSISSLNVLSFFYSLHVFWYEVLFFFY